MNPERSRIEDEARMQELRELFALLEERAMPRDTSFDEESHSIERAFRILSWDDFESDSDPVDNHQMWLKALQYVMSYLRLALPSEDTSLLSKFKQTLTKYTEIKYPNLLVVIQPKLQLINSIEA